METRDESLPTDEPESALQNTDAIRVEYRAHLWDQRLCDSSRIHALRRKHCSPTRRLKRVSATKLHRAKLATKNTFFSPHLPRGRQFLGLPLPHPHLPQAIQQPLHHLECVVPGIDRLSPRPCFILLPIWKPGGGLASICHHTTGHQHGTSLHVGRCERRPPT